VLSDQILLLSTIKSRIYYEVSLNELTYQVKEPIFDFDRVAPRTQRHFGTISSNLSPNISPLRLTPEMWAGMEMATKQETILKSPGTRLSSPSPVCKWRPHGLGCILTLTSTKLDSTLNSLIYQSTPAKSPVEKYSYSQVMCLRLSGDLPTQNGRYTYIYSHLGSG
jgi:hypothetical protein